MSVRFFPLGEGGVLFCAGTGRLWVLNVGAACIWCLLPDFPREEDLASRLAKIFHISVQQAQKDVVATLDFFRSQGLLEGGFFAPFSPDPRWEIPFQQSELSLVHDSPEKASYRLAGYNFSLYSEDVAVARQVAYLFGHLQLAESDETEETLGVVAAARGWDIGFAGRHCVAKVSQEAVLPHLMTLIFIRACESLHHRLLFHAGVIVDRTGAVLFPGQMGSGKTTLIAALATAGLGYFSDELAVIDTASLQVEPFPMPMSIKPGSVPVLTPFYPALESMQIHPRDDGKMVRYLLPPETSLPGAELRASIKAVIFPRFTAEGNNDLRQICPTEALERLAMTGSSNRPLTTEDVTAMIKLSEGDCYELIYDNLPAALCLLKAENILTTFTEVL